MIEPMVFLWLGIGALVVGVVGIIGSWMGLRSTQIARAKGGSVVIQSGCNVSGDMVGGDLVKTGEAKGRCQYCGAAQ